MNENIKIINRLNLKGSILSINKIDNGVIVITQNYQACKIQNSQIEKLTTLANSSFMPHKYSKNSSANNNFICMAKIGSKETIIAKVENDIKLLFKAKIHKTDMSASSFSKDNKYLVTGGEDGRIHIYQTNNFKKIQTLPYCPDYIAALNFSKDSRFLFVSCFNKSNIIFDFQRGKVTSIFNTNEVVEWGDYFDNNSKIFLILRNLSSIIYDTIENKIINYSSPFKSWPSIFCIDDSEKIAIVGSRDSTIYLINIKDNTKIFDLKLENKTGISSICLNFGYIFIGYTSGELLILSYDDQNNEFKKVCEKKDYKNAALMIDKNIFLSLLPYAKIFDEDWDFILKKAISLLSINKIDEAIDLTNPFTRDIAKKEIFNFYLNKKDVFKYFQELIDKKSYEEAYNMTLQIKYLTKTSHFEQLDNAWHKAFNSAKKILEENVDIENAKKHLEPFMKTSKKETIIQLLNNFHIFKDAEKLVKKQKFKEYFMLSSNFAYLQDTELYKKVILLGESFFEKAIEHENKNEYKEFERLAKFLQDFPAYKEIITIHIVNTAKKIEILNLIKQNKKYEVYKLASEYDELQYLKEFKEFCKDFDGKYDIANEIAFKGNPEALENVFQDYIRIDYWFNKIKNVFQIAYLEEFKNKVDSNDNTNKINWGKSIKNYIQIFGKDDDITDFCALNGFENLLNNDDENEIMLHPFKFQKTLISLNV